VIWIALNKKGIGLHGTMRRRPLAAQSAMLVRLAIGTRPPRAESEEPASPLHSVRARVIRDSLIRDS